MMKEFLNDTDARMQKTLNSVQEDFAAVRAGRANAQVLDRISVEYYGTPTPLNQVATIASPDPRQLTSSLGISPCSRPLRRPSTPPTWVSTPRTMAVSSA